MPNPEVIEIEGWKCTRHNDFHVEAKKDYWTVSLFVDRRGDSTELDIDCGYGATRCFVPLTVIQQLQTWHEESKARREAENG